MITVGPNETLFSWQNDVMAARLLGCTTHSWTLQFPREEVSDCAGRTLRISAFRKVEHRLEGTKQFHCVRQLLNHAALAHYGPCQTAIFINGPLENPHSLVKACQAVIIKQTSGMRHPEEYLNAVSHVVLSSGSGNLFQGPDIFVSDIEQLLVAAGVPFVTLRSKGKGKERALQLLQLDTGFVAAEQFQFEWLQK